MISTILGAFRVKEIRNKVLFTALLLALYRLGTHIPAPGINSAAVKQIQSNFVGNSILGLLNLFSGGGLSRIAIFALGITPYITASIIVQLLTVVLPSLEKLQKDGEPGRRKITQWTRYLTVGLAIAQAFGVAFGLESAGQFVVSPGLGFILMTIVTLTAGSAFIMWIGEQITERR